MRKKESRSMGVPIQKGPIKLNSPHTMHMMTASEKVEEDSRYDSMRRDGMLLKFHQPK